MLEVYGDEPPQMGIGTINHRDLVFPELAEGKTHTGTPYRLRANGFL